MNELTNDRVFFLVGHVEGGYVNGQVNVSIRKKGLHMDSNSGGEWRCSRSSALIGESELENI